MSFEDRIRLPALNLIHRRPRLLELLTQFVETGKRLITIYAPGGYGKSILLADFAQTVDWPVCWCSLEPADRDPTSFLTLLAYSITDRFHEIEPEGLLRLVQRGDTQISIHRLTDLLAGVGPHLLIIDDYHKAISAGMTLALNKLLEQLPPASAMIVAARGDMALETGQIIDLLIAERAVGLSEEELRFTGEELQRVMRKRFGRQIDLAAAEEMAHATDGNIAQILLAGHAQSAQTDPLLGRLRQRLGSDRGVIYSYLAGEVLEKQPPELQHFLLYTSVLPELTAELSNELLEINNAQACLEELVRRDLFITQVGAGFRYHDLFTEFLRGKLAENGPVYNQVALQAAYLLEARFRYEEAINLYLSAQAWAEAMVLIEGHNKTFYDTGRALTLNHWLTQLPEAELAHSPRLLLLRGQILNNDLGDPKLALTFFRRAEERFLEQGDLISVAETQVVRASTLRMMGQAKEGLVLATNGLQQLIALAADKRLIAWATRHCGLTHITVGNLAAALLDLRQALGLFETLDDTYSVGACHHDIGVCLEKQGNINGAEHHYQQALRLWETLGNANDLANTLNSLGVCCYLRGAYDEALKRFQESLDIALRIGATRRAAFAQASLGDAYLECQKYKQAVEAYTISTHLAREVEARSLEVYNLIKQGECFYRQQNLTRALDLAGQAEEIAAETGLAFELGLAAALQAKIYVRRGEYEASYRLFTTAAARLAGGDALEQARARLWWGYGLLLDLRPAAALQQLQEALKLALALGELKHGLKTTAAETNPLLLHFLHREDTPAGLRDNLRALPGHDQTNSAGLLVFAFGPPMLIVAGKRRQFTQRGGMPKTPEFLLYLLIEGQEGGCRWSDVATVLWPDLDSERASRNFHQILKRLRDVIFEAPDYLLRRDDYYQVNPAYLTWCDALAFERLYERAGRAAPETALALQLELIGMYQGEFLAGFELSEWGETYRAACEARFFQAVELAGAQLLRAGSAQEALAVAHKGLALDYFREDLHRLALQAYACLGLRDHLANHYTQMRTAFDAELGGPPEPETQQLYNRLLVAGQPALAILT